MASVLRPPSTEEEWRAYHAIRERVLWEARGLTGYDPDHPDERAEGHHPLLYVLGEAPVGVVRVDIDGPTATLRRVAVREEAQRRGHGREMLRLAEAFARSRGTSLVRSTVDADAVGFYRKAGYRAAGPPTRTGSVPMEKAL